MGELSGSDEVWRTATYAAIALVAVAYLVGGLVTRVAGAWRLPDGLVMELKQVGPFVWGRSAPPGGRQIYRGQAVWGHLRMRRWDFGAAHLQRLGFDDHQAALVEGRETGTFRLRRAAPNLLEGDFIGYAFSFDDAKGASSRPSAPVPRRIQRV